jgi:hypothetical protein
VSRSLSAAAGLSGPDRRSPFARLVDRGAVTAAFVGLGVAAVLAISFLLIIPIEPIYWVLSIPAGLLIGYYAGVRSGRLRGEWLRFLGNALFAGAATGLTLAALLLGVKALFFYADNGYPDYNRTDTTGAAIPPTCRIGADCVYHRYLVDQGAALERAGVTDAASFQTLYWDQQLNTAELLLLVSVITSLAGGAVFGLTRPRLGTTADRPNPRVHASGQPKHQDVAIRELSEMLVALPEDPTPGRELLDASRLDYSIESLAHLDDYLDVMRTRELSSRDSAVVVMRSGAYVGEVIRRNSLHRTYHWLDYEDAVRIDDLVGQLGDKNVGVVAVLWAGGKVFVFPLGKVLKFLENGREDSTQFFAAAIVALGAE